MQIIFHLSPAILKVCNSTSMLVKLTGRLIQEMVVNLSLRKLTANLSKHIPIHALALNFIYISNKISSIIEHSKFVLRALLIYL